MKQEHLVVEHSRPQEGRKNSRRQSPSSRQTFNANHSCLLSRKCGRLENPQVSSADPPCQCCRLGEEVQPCAALGPVEMALASLLSHDVAVFQQLEALLDAAPRSLHVEMLGRCRRADVKAPDCSRTLRRKGRPQRSNAESTDCARKTDKRLHLEEVLALLLLTERVVGVKRGTKE